MAETMQMQVTAKIPANEKKGTPQLGPVTVTVQTYATAAEMIKAFGDEAVKSNAETSWKSTIQAGIRTALLKGATPEQIQETLGASKMGVTGQKISIDPVQAFMAKFVSSPPAEQQKLLAELTKKAAKAK